MADASPPPDRAEARSPLIPDTRGGALAVVILLVIVHLALAFASALPTVHTGGDNAAYLSLAESLAHDGSYREAWHPGAPPHTKYPPLYPAVLAGLVLLGAKTWGAFKGLSLLFTALSTAICFRLVRRRHDLVFAAGVSLLFGSATAVLFAAQWILSDPLFLALTLAALCLLTARSRAAHPEGEGETGRPSLEGWEVNLGLVLAVAAYFTRSAGLPLVVAIAVWLGMRRLWGRLAVFGAGFALPAVLWWLRDARTGRDYVSEFWMIHPYAPELGRASAWDLVERVAQNFWLYTSEYVPAGLTGLGGATAAVVGIVLAGLTLHGWARRSRRGMQVLELFFLLYVGLILVWPAVWSGDRFALPLFPLVLLYSAESVHSLTSLFWSRYARRTVLAGAVLLAIPVALSWIGRVGTANECRARVRTGGPMACYGQNVRDFHAMALWSGTHLDPDARVFSRKPRLFYVFSGRPSATFPFVTDGQSLLADADSLGIGYLVRGTWDRSISSYVDPVIARHPERFCRVAQMQSGARPPTYLLAIVEPRPEDPSPPEEEEIVIPDCLDEEGTIPPPPLALASMRVPILER